jgi:hypothetical protein
MPSITNDGCLCWVQINNIATSGGLKPAVTLSYLALVGRTTSFETAATRSFNAISSPWNDQAVAKCIAKVRGGM